MADFFGMDIGGLISSIGGALQSLAPAPAQGGGFTPASGGGGEFTPAPAVAGPNLWPTVTMPGQGLQPAQLNLGTFQPSGGDYGGFQPSGLGYGGFAPSPGLSSSPFQPTPFNPLTFDPNAKPATTPGATGTTTGGGTPGAGFGNPTAQQLDQMFAGTALAGQGQTVLSAASEAGVPASVAVAIIKAESSFQTPAGGTRNNFGGLKNPQGGGFADFPDVASGLRAVIGNMGSSIYHGLTLKDFLYKYLGGPEGGDVNQYYANVLATISSLGGTTDLNAVPVGAPQRPTSGGAGLAGIFGGTVPPIMQEFGHTDYSEAHPSTYAYGNAYGLEGSQHPGVDYGMARGSQLYVPVSGTVVYAGGTGYYTDQNGDGPGRGELLIQLANGDQVILGHMSQIGLQVGQQVTAGTLAGLSGGSDGDHLHLEYRRRNANGGYTIVDPRTML